jgi:hypothetical protein
MHHVHPEDVPLWYTQDPDGYTKPWESYREENGSSLNFAVQTNTPGTNKADYLGKLKPDALNNKDSKKMFVDNFPTLPENASNDP